VSAPAASNGRSTADVARAVIDDTRLLVKKEIELARHEITGALVSRAKGAAALAVAGVAGLLAAAFLSLAVVAALDNVVRPWASRLIVGGAWTLLALAGLPFGIRHLRWPPLAPKRAQQSVRKEVEWAKTQITR
jgi:hypothetical protein